MARYFRLPFATQGDRTIFPDDTQGDGSLSYNQGYGPDYQRTPGTDTQARRIERDRFNQLVFDLTSTLQLYYQESVPPYITTTDNNGISYAYAQYSRVRYDPGTGERVYESLISNNTSLPTVTTAWRLADFDGLDARYPVGQLGQADGNIPQIGTPSTVGRSAVVVNSGSNANGDFQVWSDGFKIVRMNRPITPTGSVITLPITFNNNNYFVAGTHGPGGTDFLGVFINSLTSTTMNLRHSGTGNNGFRFFVSGF